MHPVVCISACHEATNATPEAPPTSAEWKRVSACSFNHYPLSLVADSLSILICCYFSIKLSLSQLFIFPEIYAFSARFSARKELRISKNNYVSESCLVPSTVNKSRLLQYIQHQELSANLVGLHEPFAYASRQDLRR